METAIGDTPRCTCQINHPFGSMADAEIIYCPLHAAAEDMYEALKASKRAKWPFEVREANLLRDKVLAKAEGRQ